jgi:hypothetical protein
MEGKPPLMVWSHQPVKINGCSNITLSAALLLFVVWKDEYLLLIPLRNFLKATRKNGYFGNLSTLHQIKEIPVNIKTTKCFTPINNLTM